MNDIKIYLSFNPDLKNLDKIKLFEEYLNDKKTFNRITTIESFFKRYSDFNIKSYIESNISLKNLSNIEILVHYHLNNNILNQNILNQNNKPRLAHIFVHFFEIGGGESYLSNFNKYNNIFEETLFINANYPNKTLFSCNSKIILYKSYYELNKYLFNFDIILDHQLYWFDIDYSIQAFNNIPYNNIIRISHGVPIHQDDITFYNYYYSIELYKDYNSHISWNNHIKIYNNIGVKIPDIKNNNLIFKRNIMNTMNNKINVAIVGRIDKYKVPLTFLDELVKFTEYNNNYIFNFYGLLDKKYQILFENKIKKSKTIFYHNVIHPSKIQIIYENNEILLHPSKSEAGATVILEAMSYGLPVICRNSGGLPNATGNHNFLCNSDEDFFINLLKIDENIYNDISIKNILKIENENREDNQFNKLINIIYKIYQYENLLDIPNIIHYIYGLEKQTTEFPFVYYVSILSNHLINKPYIIFFHYQYEPYGFWWEKVRDFIQLNYINADNLHWGKKKIIKYAHKADKIRLEMLLKYGGIYMDIDTITYRSYKDLLKYDFVIGIQSENYGKENITLYCNAILLSKKNNIFIKKWMEKYEYYFNSNDWCKASVHLPHLIFKSIDPYENNIKILEKEYFYYPSYDETDKIFEKDENINEKLITLHLWSSFSNKYYNNIFNFDWDNDSLYSKLLKNIKNLL